MSVMETCIFLEKSSAKWRRTAMVLHDRETIVFHFNFADRADIKTGWIEMYKVKTVNMDQIIESITDSDFSELPISIQHAKAVSGLPNIHRDPFDRILIAQAVTEPLTFLTADAILENYSDLVEIIT
jgi:hypothetical protein